MSIPSANPFILACSALPASLWDNLVSIAIEIFCWTNKQYLLLPSRDNAHIYRLLMSCTVGDNVVNWTWLQCAVKSEACVLQLPTCKTTSFDLYFLMCGRNTPLNQFLKVFRLNQVIFWENSASGKFSRRRRLGFMSSPIIGMGAFLRPSAFAKMWPVIRTFALIAFMLQIDSLYSFYSM